MTSLPIILLRFDAPLMSFGGTKVDEHNVTEQFPGLSLITGLIGNALGFDHRESERLERLQERLSYAVRRDRGGAWLSDYQTVDLGQEFLREGWTTRHAPQKRAGGTAKATTHIRHRHYWADAVFTVALTLEEPGETPTIDEVAAALRYPERPLFLGRKCCLPALPLLLDTTSAPSLREALAKTEPSRPSRTSSEDGFLAWWPADESETSPGRLLPVTDQRDWTNQIHVGRRFVGEGRIRMAGRPEANDDDD